MGVKELLGNPLRQSMVKRKIKALNIMQLWRTVASDMASFMFMWTFVRPYLPKEIRHYFQRWTLDVLARFYDFYPYVRINIHEYTRDRYQRSKVFEAVESYLSKKTLKTGKTLKAEMEGKKVVLTMDEEQESITDEYNGVEVTWLRHTIPPPSSTSSSSAYYFCREPEKRLFRIEFHKRNRKLITESYLEHVMKEGKSKAKQTKTRLYTNISGAWTSIVFEHPGSFETIAMEAEKKQEIIDDLETFRNSKEYYARIGKAWKRGYLLYGPPGTGKSTLIAAIANLLNYHLYHLELTAVKDNSELRKLLIQTTSKSVIVIEDIDCSLDLTGQRKNMEPKVSEPTDEGDNKKVPEKELVVKEDSSKVTLSGVLNIIDGLWSASGGERLIIFTTNYVEKLDPALIRRGRMDKHIQLSYCSFEGFKVLAKNYLKIDSHPLFDEVKKLLEETKVIPADIAENLMPKSLNEDTEKRLMKLIQVLGKSKDPRASEEEIKAVNQEESAMEKFFFCFLFYLVSS